MTATLIPTILLPQPFPCWALSLLQRMCPVPTNSTNWCPSELLKCEYEKLVLETFPNLLEIASALADISIEP
jgi:hypothetical protein